jgi:proteasome lid subunit RPN8/RPN11|tara:strand:- start:39 stop:494 length:456 start_codon:yes stop_codon:yes gene_type:complete
MVVTIPNELNQRLIKICEDGFPYEVCGYLLGEVDRAADGLITTYSITGIFPVKNINEVNPKRMFNINPLDFVKAEEAAKKKSISLLGVYHSHPDEDSYASSTDNAYCQIDMCALIYSIKQNKFNEVKAFMPKIDKKNKDSLFFEETKFKIL